MAALAESGEPAVRTTYSDGGQHAFWAAYTARGGAVGDISRPEALAYAGQEAVVVPGHRAPRPVPEGVWAAWGGPDSGLALRQMAGFVPIYERAPDPFGVLASRLPARYGDGLPSLLAAALSESPGPGAGRPILAGSGAALIASAERL